MEDTTHASSPQKRRIRLHETRTATPSESDVSDTEEKHDASHDTRHAHDASHDQPQHGSRHAMMRDAPSMTVATSLRGTGHVSDDDDVDALTYYDNPLAEHMNTHARIGAPHHVDDALPGLVSSTSSERERELEREDVQTTWMGHEHGIVTTHENEACVMSMHIIADSTHD